MSNTKKKEVELPHVESRTLTKHRVVLSYMVEVEVIVYAEDTIEAEDIANDQVRPVEYANDTIGFDYSGDYIDSDTNYMKADIIEIQCNTDYLLDDKTYSEDMGEEVELFCVEGDDWDNNEDVFASEEEALDNWKEYNLDEEDEEEDEEDE
jgi:hypothetical protein